MYLPLTLIPLSTISWPTSLPIPENGQAAVALPITSATPTAVIESLGKRQSTYAPAETHGPILQVMAGAAADALKERASDANNNFDSLLCATLKALKSENPNLFTSLLQSCNSLTDSGSTRRTKTLLKGRNVVDDQKDLAADVEADVDGSGEANLGRSEANLPDERDLDSSF